MSSSRPAWPTNGRPCLSSFAPGRLADEHQVGVGVARAEDHLRPRGGELRALRARLRLLPDRLELFAPRLRRGHVATIPTAPATGAGTPDFAGCYTPLDQPVSPCENWTGTTHYPPVARSSARAASAPPSPPRCAPPASRSTARCGRGADPGVDAVLLCVPDARDARPPPRSHPRRARRPLLRRQRRSTCSTAHEAFSPAPADDRRRPAARRAFAGRRRAPSPAARRARSRSRSTWPGGSGCARPPWSTTRPRRLPRGRLDRLELPRHARGRGGAARRAPPGVDRALLAPLVAAAVDNWARLGARAARSPARSRAATRPRSPASAPPSRSARPTCCRCSTRSRTRPASWRWSPRDEDPAHDRRGPRARRRGARAPAAASGSSRRWARSTPATRR